jgi:hypothetical protein
MKNFKMNLHQKNKVDISVSNFVAQHNFCTAQLLWSITEYNTQSLSPDEQRLFRLYGKLPYKSDHLKERKYFDSGDYALSKAGRTSSVDTESIGSQHPLPENIPHLSSPGVGIASQGGSGNSNMQPGAAGCSQSASPVKERSILNREASVEELEDKDKADEGNDNVNPPHAKDGIPVGR